MGNELPNAVVDGLENEGWFVPSPHEPFDEGGGARIYLCHARDLLDSLLGLAGAAKAAGLPAHQPPNMAARAVSALHRRLLVDKTGVAVLKVPKQDKGSPKRAKREIEAMRKVAGPGLVRLLAADDGDPALWFVVQYYPRGSIGKAREQFEGRPLDVLKGTLQVADALVRVHGNDLVHRDVKPGNIFLGDDGEWILGDFGIALDATQPRLTAASDDLWSRDWMPDWMAGEPLAKASPVVDVYMLALTAYSMICGKKPRASQMDEAKYDLSEMYPGQPHIRLVSDFFREHIRVKEGDVKSKTAHSFRQRLARLIDRLGDPGRPHLLFSFESSQSTTDVAPNGRPFTVSLMNPKACSAIALSVRGSGAGRVTLTFDEQTPVEQTASIPLPEREAWFNMPHTLEKPLAEGRVFLKAVPEGGTMSGLLVWAL